MGTQQAEQVKDILILLKMCQVHKMQFAAMSTLPNVTSTIDLDSLFNKSTSGGWICFIKNIFILSGCTPSVTCKWLYQSLLHNGIGQAVIEREMALPSCNRKTLLHQVCCIFKTVLPTMAESSIPLMRWDLISCMRPKLSASQQHQVLNHACKGGLCR